MSSTNLLATSGVVQATFSRDMLTSALYDSDKDGGQGEGEGF